MRRLESGFVVTLIKYTNRTRVLPRERSQKMLLSVFLYIFLNITLLPKLLSKPPRFFKYGITVSQNGFTSILAESKQKIQVITEQRWDFSPGGMQNDVYDFGGHPKLLAQNNLECLLCGAPHLATRLTAGLNFSFRDGIQFSINIPTTKKQWNIRSIDTLSPGA